MENKTKSGVQEYCLDKIYMGEISDIDEFERFLYTEDDEEIDENGWLITENF